MDTSRERSQPPAGQPPAGQPPARQPRAGLRRAIVAAALLAGACAPAPVPSAPAPAVADDSPVLGIARRLHAGVARPAPDLVGLPPADVLAAAAAGGATPRLIAFSSAATATAQDPAPGAPLPEDGTVVVWLGTPEPPPAPAAPAPAPAASPAAPAESLGVGPTAFEIAGRDGTGPADPDPSASFGGVQSAPPAAPPPPAPGPSRPGAVPDPHDDEPDGAVLEGLASWYGPGFAGKRTACGDVFDPQDLTLASRELGCGTRVRITGPTGRQVDAVVTDHGPAAWTGRRFDLSAATFAAIADPAIGVVPVRVLLLP